MAYFHVKLSNLRRAEADLQKAVDKLAQAANKIDSAEGSWVLRGSSAFSKVRNKLNASHNNVLSLEQRAGYLRSALLDVAAIYESVEKDILNLGLEDAAIRAAVSSSVDSLTVAGKELQGYCPEGIYSPDPVNLATGNYILEKRFMAQEGIAAFSLRLFYNSSNRDVGCFGRGWTSNLEFSLEILSPEKVALHGYDASVVPFHRITEGVYYASRGRAGSILRIDSGWLFIDDEKQISFSNEGNLVLLSDRNGNGVLFVYDEDNRLTGLRSSSGIELRCVWEGEGISKITDGESREVGFSYADELLTAVTDEMGARTEYQYNDRQLLSGIVNGNGVLCLANEYDGKDRVVCQRFPDGGEQNYRYDDEKGHVVLTQQNGSQITYVHDQRFNIIRTEYEDGTEAFSYNEENRRTSYMCKRGGTTLYNYDAAGNLSRLQSAAGSRIEIEYDRNHKPLSLRLDQKTVLSAEYDKNGNPLSYRDADGRVERYVYNDSGQIVRIEQADGSCVEAEYDNRGNITALINAAGGRESFSYDKYNRIVAYSDGNGNRTELTYYLNNRIKTVKNALGFVRRYSYDACGNLTEVEDFDGSKIRVEYNAINKPAVYTDQRDNSTRYEYDLMWDLVRRIDPNQAVTTYDYDGLQRLTGITDALGRRSSCRRDANGNIVERVSASGDVFKIEYDEQDRPIRVIRPDQTVLTAQYDALGRVTVITDALGGQTVYTYNFNGDILSVTDPSGYCREQNYDALGNLTEIRDRHGVLLRREYYPGGLLKKETGQDGSSMEFAYDANQNIVRRTNQDGYWWQYEYDCLNRLIAVRTAEGLLEAYAYDAVDNLISIADAEGNRTEYAYSPTGKITCMTDPLGNQTFYEYDEMDRLTSIRQPELGSAGAQEVIAQNRQTNSWRTITMERDAMGNVIRQRNALAQESRYSYNAENLLCEVADEDGFITKFDYSYDSLPKGILYADGRQISMQYDPLRHLQEFRDTLGVTVFTRDAVGRVQGITDPQGETIGYAYNDRGQRTMLRYPNGNELLYRYNEKGQLSAIETESGDIRYDYYPNGLLREKRLPNGASSLYTYRPDGMVSTQCQHTASGEELRRSASYNSRGLKSALCVTQNGAETSYAYEYDPLGSLTAVKKDGELYQAFTYDAFGNRLTFWENGQTTRFRYNSGNQLVESEGAEGLRRFSYDARGNLTEEQLNGQIQCRLAFGVDGLLQRAETPAGSASYHYNGFRQRVRQERMDSAGKILDEVRMCFDTAIGPKGNLLQRTRRDKVQTCIWDEELLGLQEAAEFTGYLNDLLGSPVIREGAGGRREYRYDVFGAGTGTEEIDFGFTGYVADPVTGTCYAKAREYAPRLGRFISRDPVPPDIFRPLAMNLYYYCANDAVNRVDPDGRIWVQLAAGLVGAVANVVTKVVTSAVSGEDLNWQDVVGSAAGGFAGGFATASGVPPAAAGAIAGAVEAGVSGAAHMLSGSGKVKSWSEVGMNVVTDAATGAAAGWAFGAISKNIKIPGVTGRGGWGHVWKTQMTRAAHGFTSNISMKTLLKGFGYETLASLFSGAKSGLKKRLKQVKDYVVDKASDKIRSFIFGRGGDGTSTGAMCPLAA